MLKQASFNSNYYASTKSKYRENEPILSINVSEANLNRAYRIIDSLIDTLDNMEGQVFVRKKLEKDIGEFLLLNTGFYFEIKEKITRWIEWARNKADWLDSLVAKKNVSLGKNKHIFEVIYEMEQELR